MNTTEVPTVSKSTANIKNSMSSLKSPPAVKNKKHYTQSSKRILSNREGNLNNTSSKLLSGIKRQASDVSRLSQISSKRRNIPYHNSLTSKDQFQNSFKRMQDLTVQSERSRLFNHRTEQQLKRFIKKWGNDKAKLSSKQVQKTDINLLGLSYQHRRRNGNHL